MSVCLRGGQWRPTNAVTMQRICVRTTEFGTKFNNRAYMCALLARLQLFHSNSDNNIMPLLRYCILWGVS